MSDHASWCDCSGCESFVLSDKFGSGVLHSNRCFCVRCRPGYGKAHRETCMMRNHPGPCGCLPKRTTRQMRRYRRAPVVNPLQPLSLCIHCGFIFHGGETAGCPEKGVHSVTRERRHYSEITKSIRALGADLGAAAWIESRYLNSKLATGLCIPVTPASELFQSDDMDEDLLLTLKSFKRHRYGNLARS